MLRDGGEFVERKGLRAAGGVDSGLFDCRKCPVYVEIEVPRFGE